MQKMTIETIKTLNELNRQFYQTVAESFSASRQQPWTGWEKMWEVIQPLLPETPILKLFDIGAGNGRFEDFFGQKLLDTSEQKFEFTLIDQSEALTSELKEKSLPPSSPGGVIMQADFVLDLLRDNEITLQKDTFDLVVSFGVVHHIPSLELRKLFFEKVTDFLLPGGLFVVSFWQFNRNPKLIERQAAAEEVGLTASDFEQDDYLLTWERGQKAIRYCHLVDAEEQAQLIKDSGLKIISTFESDGKDNQQNQYLVFQK